MTNLTQTNVNELIQSNEPILVDFWATWCPSCMRNMPSVTALSDEGYNVATANVEEMRDFAKNNGVRGLPTFLVFKDGVVINKKTGYSTKEELIGLLTSSQENIK